MTTPSRPDGVTPQQWWDGPVQDAIRHYDQRQVAFFRPQFPTGGTVFALPVEEIVELPGGESGDES